MKELSVREILEYSRNIEQESFGFYTQVNRKFEDKELKALTAELAQSEEDHYNRICRLLEETEMTESDLSSAVSISREDYDFLVTTRALPKDPTPRWILETAFEREKSTGNVYRTLLSFTNLSEDVIEVFSDLILQEEGHAGKIKRKLDKL